MSDAKPVILAVTEEKPLHKKPPNYKINSVFSVCYDKYPQKNLSKKIVYDYIDNTYSGFRKTIYLTVLKIGRLINKRDNYD
jgi:hypothetical protein